MNSVSDLRASLCRKKGMDWKSAKRSVRCFVTRSRSPDRRMPFQSVSENRNEGGSESLIAVPVGMVPMPVPSVGNDVD